MQYQHSPTPTHTGRHNPTRHCTPHTSAIDAGAAPHQPLLVQFVPPLLQVSDAALRGRGRHLRIPPPTLQLLHLHPQLLQLLLRRPPSALALLRVPPHAPLRSLQLAGAPVKVVPGGLALAAPRLKSPLALRDRALAVAHGTLTLPHVGARGCCLLLSRRECRLAVRELALRPLRFFPPQLRLLCRLSDFLPLCLHTPCGFA